MEIPPQQQLTSIIITGLISGIGSGLLSHYLASRRTISEMKKNNYLKQIELIYIPIIQVIDAEIEPTIGYEGLSDKSVNKIIEVVRANLQFVDIELERLVWGLKEDQYFYYRDKRNYFSYDEKGDFNNYVQTKYNWIRKQLLLPHNNRYFFYINKVDSYLRRKYRHFNLRRVQRRLKNDKKGHS